MRVALAIPWAQKKFNLIDSFKRSLSLEIVMNWELWFKATKFASEMGDS